MMRKVGHGNYETYEKETNLGTIKRGRRAKDSDDVGLVDAPAAGALV